MTSRNTWKQRERQIALYFGTKRTPLSGGNSRHTRSDSLHPRLFVESKLRVKHSAVSLWRKTADLARAEGKTPVIALCEKHRPGFWIMVHSSDLQAVASEAADLPEPVEVIAEQGQGGPGERQLFFDDLDGK